MSYASNTSRQESSQGVKKLNHSGTLYGKDSEEIGTPVRLVDKGLEDYSGQMRQG